MRRGSVAAGAGRYCAPAGAPGSPTCWGLFYWAWSSSAHSCFPPQALFLGPSMDGALLDGTRHSRPSNIVRPRRPWRASSCVAYTGSSRDQVTTFSWISRRQSSTPWTKCSANVAQQPVLKEHSPSWTPTAHRRQVAANFGQPRCRSNSMVAGHSP